MLVKNGLVASILAVSLSAGSAVPTSKVENVVVLMLENRAFDHMLGYLQEINPEISGCSPETCSNPRDPSDSTSPEVPFSYNAVYQQADPCHQIDCTTRQVFGSDDDSVPATNTGFVKDYAKATGNETYADQIMDGFHPTHVPAIYNLSLEYAVYDEWYASVPGPTMVNRAYAASATSHGMGWNDPKLEGPGLPQKTMFEQLLEMGLDYRVYFQQFPSVLQHKGMRRNLSKYHQLHKFYKDVEKGDLPEFTWLEPGYFDGNGFSATDQHPDHDVSAGDDLIRKVYNALRKSPLWEKTALVITYDEHGGFFDHIPPPQPVPSPDNITSTDIDPAFDFKRLGIRIPTVVVSPLIPKGTVVHSTEREGEYEHSSIVSTIVHKLFKPEEGKPEPEFLTARDAWASTFEDVFSLDEARKDCPMEAPSVEAHRVQFPDLLPPLDGKMPVSDLQKELVQIAATIAIEGKCDVHEDLLLGKVEHENEGEAGEWIMKRVEECLGMTLERS